MYNYNEKFFGLICFFLFTSLLCGCSDPEREAMALYLEGRSIIDEVDSGLHKGNESNKLTEANSKFESVASKYPTSIACKKVLSVESDPYTIRSIKERQQLSISSENAKLASSSLQTYEQKNITVSQSQKAKPPGVSTPDGKIALAPDVIAALYINAGRVWQQGIEFLRNIDTPANAPLKSLMKFLWGIPASNSESRQPVFEDVVKKILDFDQLGLFRPTGALWFSFTSVYRPSLSYQPTLTLEATIKPLKFLNYLTVLPPDAPNLEKAEENLVRFRIPARDSLSEIILEIRPNGIVLGNQAKNLMSVFPDLVAFANIPENIMAIEFDGQKLLAAIRREADPAKAEMLMDPRFETFKRACLQFRKSSAWLGLAFNDTALIENLVSIGKMQFQAEKVSFSQMPMLIQNPELAEQLKKVMEKISIFSQDEWVGMAADGVEASMLLVGAGVTGIIAVIAHPNFRLARDRARQMSCRANMAMLAIALEMYARDNSQPMTHLDLNLLKGYLKTVPECLVGSYTLEKSSQGYVIRCSQHGDY